MVIIDGKFVYADYSKEDTFESYFLDVMGQCISEMSDRKTFVCDTGFLEEVKAQEVKKRVTLSQLYAERGVGVKFRFLSEPYIYEICGEDTDYSKQQVFVLDIWDNGKVVGTMCSHGSWYVETI